MRINGSRACIVGAGTSHEFGFDLGKSPLRLQFEAFVQALNDAGLDRSDIDGFATAQGSPSGVDYEEFTATMGLECRYVDQAWGHGRWATGLVAHASVAVLAGLADYVAIANATVAPRGYLRHLRGLGSGNTIEGLRDVGGGHGEWVTCGIDSPGAATSFVAKRYMDKYGISSHELAEISISFRRNAALNPMAIMRNKPLNHTLYDEEPVISGPFHRCDYSLSSEGATCLIVTSEERALDLAQRPVYVSGVQGLQTSREDYVLFSRPGLGVGFAEDRPYVAGAESVYTMAGLERDELDGLFIYDAFASNLWIVLERFGFCGEGEAASWISENGISIGSDLPVNTNGGLMSEGHYSGYAHLVEMTRQLRDQAGDRQIAGATSCQWATPWGDSLILTS